MKNKILNKKFLTIFFTSIYLVLCLIMDFCRTPFWDEARSWLISQNCNVFEFLSLMKLECHLFIWNLIIFPFAKLNFLYPYSMQILNTLISAWAVFILWKKAPFSILEKFLITFSVPFLFLWGVVARCYSIGILFLFFALIYYKTRSKNPFKYLVYLCLAMNTSVMAFIGGFYLALIFLLENIKQKNFLKLLLIFALNIVIVVIQVYSFDPDYMKQLPDMTFLRDFLAFIFHPLIYIPQYSIQSILMSILRVLSIICTFCFGIYTLKNNKKVFLYIFSVYFSLIMLFSLVYSGNFWHYFYFYFYFIVALWILKKENKVPKFLNLLFNLVLICFMFKGSLFIDSTLPIINDSTSSKIAYELLNNPKYKNKKLFCLDAWSDIVPASLPYLKNKIVIYDIFNQDRFTYKSMRAQIRFNNELFNPDEFYKFVDDNSILITSTAFIRHEKLNLLKKTDEKTGKIDFIGKNYIVSFIPLESKKEIHLWSYEIKVNKILQK